MFTTDCPTNTATHTINFTQTAKPINKIYHTVKLPCRQYIAKYAHQVYGDPVRADNKSLFGSYLALSLEKKLFDNRNFGKSFRYKGMDGQVLIGISRWQFDRIGFDLSLQSIISLNRFLERDFEKELYQFCYLRVDSKKRFNGLQSALTDFSAIYGFDEDLDISHDGLKKKLKRYTDRVNGNQRKNQ